MVWFDLVTPKSVLFFKPFIEEIKRRDRKVLVTAREGEGYTEVVDLLNLYGIEFFNRGTFGGASLGDKLRASIHRQLLLMEFIEEHNIDRLICLCSVDANRVAFGLGIPIVNFYDIPLSDYQSNFKKALPQARLTIPLSFRAFRPFMVPQEIFERFCLESDQIHSYAFLDVVAWLKGFKASREIYEAMLKALSADIRKPTIVVREEEFKASYVQKKYPILYEALEILKDKVDANFIIIPRYEPEPLKEMFPFAKVLNEKMVIQHLLAYCDLFIGGGGTINSEACYFGTPTISTRSFVSHYDKMLIDMELMKKVDTKEELVDTAMCIMGSRNIHAKELLNDMEFDIKKLVDKVLE